MAEFTMLNDVRQSPTEYNLPALAVSHLEFDVIPADVLFKQIDTLKNNFGVSTRKLDYPICNYSLFIIEHNPEGSEKTIADRVVNYHHIIRTSSHRYLSLIDISIYNLYSK